MSRQSNIDYLQNLNLVTSVKVSTCTASIVDELKNEHNIHFDLPYMAFELYNGNNDAINLITTSILADTEDFIKNKDIFLGTIWNKSSAIEYHLSKWFAYLQSIPDNHKIKTISWFIDDSNNNAIRLYGSITIPESSYTQNQIDFIEEVKKLPHITNVILKTVIDEQILKIEGSNNKIAISCGVDFPQIDKEPKLEFYLNSNIWDDPNQHDIAIKMISDTIQNTSHVQKQNANVS